MTPIVTGAVLGGLGAISAFAIAAATVSVRTPDPWADHLAEMESRLERAWQARHPGPPLPEACEHDQVWSGDFEIDEAPGRELVIASHRLGIAMFAASGELLAFVDPRGCPASETNLWINTVLQGGQPDFDGLVMREEVRGCRSTTTVTLWRRRGDTLANLARYRDQDTDQCAWDGGGGSETLRWVHDVRSTTRGLQIEIHGRCGGVGCEGGITRSDCSLGFDGWMSPSCRPIVD